MSQGYTGAHLQYAITCEAMKRKLDRQGISLITHIEVDPKDEKFQNLINRLDLQFHKGRSGLSNQDIWLHYA